MIKNTVKSLYKKNRSLMKRFFYGFMIRFKTISKRNQFNINMVEFEKFCLSKIPLFEK